MLRFLKNRWAPILALSICLACASHGLAAADGDPSLINEPDANTPPQGGDPDVPGGKGTAGTKYGQRWILERHVEGDEHAAQSVVVWRLITILRGLQAYWFRF